MSGRTNARMLAFERLAEHPWYGPKVKNLRPGTREKILDFIDEHQLLSRPEFAVAISIKITAVDSTSLLIAEILSVVNQEAK